MSNLPTAQRPPATIHLAHLDGWRGLAILTVIAGHFGLDSHLSDTTSTLGVEFFFALSGRLMAELLFVRQVALPIFFYRRLTRVVPALLVFVCFTTIILRGTPYQNGILAAILALTFLLNYAMAFAYRVATMDHLWSLCVEEHAYVILGILRSFVQRQRVVLLVILLIAILSILNAGIRPDFMAGSQPDFRWRTDAALGGIFLAAAFWILLRESLAPGWVSPLLMIVAVLLRLSETGSWGYAGSTILLAASVATVDRSYVFWLRLLGSRLLQYLGLISFSLYLWQQPFYKFHVIGNAPVLPMILSAVFCAVLSYILIERPARIYLNRAGPERLANLFAPRTKRRVPPARGDQ